MPGWLSMPTAILGWALLVLSVIDYRHFVLPDKLTLPLILFGLLVATMTSPADLTEHLIGALLGYLVFWGIGHFYYKLYRRDGLGLGDAKLLAAAGAWVSVGGLPTVVLLASLGGLTWVTIVTACLGKSRLRAPVPFGPSLAVGTWLVWIYGPLDWTPY